MCCPKKKFWTKQKAITPLPFKLNGQSLTQIRCNRFVLHSVYRWAYLNVRTGVEYADEQQAFAAGLVEAAHTKDLIDAHWINTVQGYCTIPLSPYCTRLHKFLKTNLDWMNQQIKANSDTQGYWHMVSVYNRFSFLCWSSRHFQQFFSCIDISSRIGGIKT